MLAMIKRKTQDEQGAYTIEFLVMLTVILFVMMLTVQVILALIQGVVFNHALSVAAQQAGARGGMDAQIRTIYNSHLPGGMRVTTQVSGMTDGITAYKTNTSQDPVEMSEGSANGNEPTVFGEIFCVKAAYQPIATGGLLGLSGDPITRVLTVSSQSSKGDNTTSPVVSNGSCS